MESLSLYDITANLRNVLDVIENEEITDTDADKAVEVINELGEMLKSKSVGVIGYIRNTDLTIDAIKAEERRLKSIRSTLENRQDRFKLYVRRSLDVLDITKVETELGTISLAKSPISVDILDMEQVPKEYQKAVVSITVDKKKIIDDFKITGVIPDGTHININNKNLRIK